MKKQIKIDENNNVTGLSIGNGTIENGIDVTDIPEEVQLNCKKYKYVSGEFIERTDYLELEEQEQNSQQEPTILELQAKIDEIQESVDLLIIGTL